MIVLKHLAQEFETDPYKIRQILRAHFGHATNMRWKWEENDPNLALARQHLTSHFAGNHTKTLSTEPTAEPTPTATSTKRSPNPSQKKKQGLDAFFNRTSSTKGTK